MTRIKNLGLKIKNYRKGFTLIELLIVIAIIGVLSALLMANFIGIRQRARDSQRKADLRQIQSALELYRSDQALYPTTGSFPACGAALTVGNSTYMQKVPCDPLGGSWDYSYSSGGTTYTLYSCLENGSDAQKDTSTNSSCTTASFTVANP